MASFDNFQQQLKHTLNNTPNADPTLIDLVNKFCKLDNPNAEAFNKLATGAKNIQYSAKSAAISSSLMNLILNEEKVLESTKFTGSSQVFKDSNAIVYKCSITKGNFIKPEFSLTKITGPVHSYNDYLAADKACREFSVENTAHYISLTGEASGCKGPLIGAADIYHLCMIDY